MAIRLGATAQKVLLLLCGGAVLGLSGSPSHYRRVLKGVTREWRAIDNRELYRAIRRLYESKLISYKENKDADHQNYWSPNKQSGLK